MAQDAYGEVVWSWRRDAGAKLAEQSVSDGDNKPAHRGEHEVSRKAIAQVMSVCSPLPCMLVCAFVCATGTRDRGCSAHPAFPAPSLFRRDNEFGKPRMQIASRERLNLSFRGAPFGASPESITTGHRYLKESR